MWNHAMVGGYVQMQECFTDIYTFHNTYNNTVALSVSFSDSHICFYRKI